MTRTNQIIFFPLPNSSIFFLIDRYRLLGGLRKIPAKELDPNVQVLVINNSKNPLTLSPIFITFKRLQVLHINDVHIQSIGMHTFWGVQNLRVLGKSYTWSTRARWKCVSIAFIPFAFVSFIISSNV